jgi:tellurite methyltransferase
MTIQEWNDRYRTGERAADDSEAAPTPLLVHLADELEPGTALDLACGAGRNALYLAKRGWRVTAVDGAPAAIEILRARAAERNLLVETMVADLESPEFSIPAGAWDLIAVCYYLQRDLFPAIRRALRPRGVVLAIVHIGEEGEAPTPKRALRGELRSYFVGWEILHEHEGKPADPAHRRSVAEIIARRPY